MLYDLISAIPIRKFGFKKDKVMKYMNVKFSIIIPAYNASQFLTFTLDSVKKQKYTNYEVIIVNDGSKDNTEEVIERYIKNNPQMKINYFWQENKGVAAARYRCGLEATGDYLAFLDADDIWYEDKLEKVACEINNSHADVIYHDIVEVSTSGKQRKIHCRTLNECDPCSDLVVNGNALPTSGTCVCMRLYREIDPFAEKKSAYEDYECWIRYAAAGAKFVHIKEFLGEYRRNENSLTLVDDKYIIDSYNNSLTFLKYLDTSKYTENELNEIKNKLKADCEFNLARSYHVQGNFEKALCLYRERFKKGQVSIRCLGRYLLALFHIKR